MTYQRNETPEPLGEDRIYAIPKSTIVDLVEKFSYDGYIHLPLWILNRFEAEAEFDVKWKQMCEENGWEFPTKPKE